jgi:hypothetical protein
MPWFVADVSSTKGDVTATLKMTDKIHKAVPNTTLMAMSAFIERLTITVTPNERSEEWLKTTIGSDYNVQTSDSGVIYVVVEQNIEKGVFPIQMMENARSNAFAYLKAHQLIKDEDSDDDDAMLAMEFE